jgi:hypothetical protein
MMTSSIVDDCIKFEHDSRHLSAFCDLAKAGNDDGRSSDRGWFQESAGAVALPLGNRIGRYFARDRVLHTPRSNSVPTYQLSPCRHSGARQRREPAIHD